MLKFLLLGLVAIVESRIHEVELNGTYSWVPVCEIDNRNGSEFVWLQNFTVEYIYNKDVTVAEVRRKLNLSSNYQVRILDYDKDDEPGYDHHATLMHHIISLDASFNKSINQTDNRTVSAGEKSTVYQLQYSAPGIFQTFLYTNEVDENDVTLLKFKVEVTPVCDGCKYALQSHHGTYLSGDNFPVLTYDIEQWTFKHLYVDKYELWASRERYLIATPDMNVSLTTDMFTRKETIQGVWIVTCAQDGGIELRSMSSGKYLRAAPNGDLLFLDRNQTTSASPSTQFTLTPLEHNKSEL